MIYPVDEYRAEVVAMPLNSAADVLSFIPQAARLAALPGGETGVFTNWPQLVARFGAPFSELLCARVREGLWDLDEALGENLGIAIVNAQDFGAFVALARELTPGAMEKLLSQKAVKTVELWEKEAESADLDADAVSFLVDWIEMFPVREDLRLRIVETPFSLFERRLLAVCAGIESLPTEYLDIAELVERGDGAASLMAADGSSPSQRLMQLAELDKTVPCSEHGSLFVTRRLGADWRLRLTVEQETSGANEIFPLESARHGIWPAQLSDTGEWVINLRHFDQSGRLNVLRSPIWLIPPYGARICLR